MRNSSNTVALQPRDSFTRPANNNLTLALPTPTARHTAAVNTFGNSLTPPEDGGFEMDFTYAFPKSSQPKQLKTSSSNENILWNDVTRDGCGFCNTKSAFCACKESQAQQQPEPQQRPASSGNGGGCSTGGLPGSCDKCRSDPLFAQKCQELRNTVVNFRPAASNDSNMYDAGTAATGPQNQQRGIPCFEVISQLEPMASKSMSELFGGQHIDGRPSTSGQGYSLDDQQAAQALQRLAGSFPSAR